MKPYTLGLYEKSMPAALSWKEKLMAAKGAGYDFIEISIDETDEKLERLDMPREERNALVDLMEEAGMPIRTMCLSGHRKYPLGSCNEETTRRSMEIMEKAIQLSADLGVRIIQLAGYDVYYEASNEETRTRFEDNLQKASLLAARSGVMLAFETMETEFMNTVEKAMKYVRQVKSPYLNVYPDAGNLTNAACMYGNDVLEDLRKGEGHVAALHLKETVPGKFREIPYGTGHVDFEAIIETAWGMGVRKYVTEFWYTGNQRWEQDLRDANEMMRNILSKQR
ncbi:L-ribulose-5-phosphate 3-epimerase [Anaerotalea alkaliphila]|uniref:L-ribulose-5-phosphate 3-epimerase n=1 Tax=Anaerotalea alkaliphila TaxID=2662126 RepID=A0A7X5KN61_9FIRM|nr:L-ribulose-5-phosphate 3-epimerase [Anaerotalea alkaliphila]NDL67694.1 L-ribulose-5-phosphate 3-epimerase [Anaerotalea alkaliphila]